VFKKKRSAGSGSSDSKVLRRLIKHCTPDPLSNLGA
jgi:hypothetical protein